MKRIHTLMKWKIARIMSTEQRLSSLEQKMDTLILLLRDLKPICICKNPINGQRCDAHGHHQCSCYLNGPNHCKSSTCDCCCVRQPYTRYCNSITHSCVCNSKKQCRADAHDCICHTNPKGCLKCSNY